MKTTRLTLIASIVILAVALLFVAALLTRPRGETEARTLVEEFSTQLQQVSLLSEDVISSMEAAYAPYATRELLDTWERDTAKAPGRLTSSPWPDRIEIKDIAPQGSGYVVTGEVVLETSAGEAGREPVIILVTKTDNGYRIAAYQEQRI